MGSSGAAMEKRRPFGLAWVEWTIPFGDRISVGKTSLRRRMEFKRSASEPVEAVPLDDEIVAEGSDYRISAHPLIAEGLEENASLVGDLPRSYGTETLCLIARDPHSLFAFWDIDWKAAFPEKSARSRKVQLRVFGAEGAEQTLVEVEPMGGSCSVTVLGAESAYRGEIGYFDPPDVWNCLGSSSVVTTPPESLAGASDLEFATVPFHITFQHMIETLRISREEKMSLTTMLRDLRERASAPETNGRLGAEQREFARALEVAHSAAPEAAALSGASANVWTQQKLEHIINLGHSSPARGWRGSGR